MFTDGERTMQSLIEAIAARRPSLVDGLLAVLPSVGDASEERDLELWRSGVRDVALPLIYRRCFGDEELLRIVEGNLLDSYTQEVSHEAEAKVRLEIAGQGPPVEGEASGRHAT